MEYKQKEPINEHFGEIVRKYREARGISQEELSRMCDLVIYDDTERNMKGVSRDYIGRIERGESNVTLLKCYKIANAFGVRLYEMFQDLPE